MEANNIVTINGTDFIVRNTLRALFVFEQISGKPFAIESTLDNFLFLYSVLLASNKDKMLSWDNFIDAVDKDKKIVDRMNEILKDSREIEQLLSEDPKEDGTDGEKKN